MKGPHVSSRDSRSIRKIKRSHALILSLAVIVALAISYLLILPARTLEKKEAAQQGGISVSEDAFTSGELSFEGKNYHVEASYDEKAKLPESTELSVKEITKKSDQYQAYYDKALKALQSDEKASAAELLFAHFYDISLKDEGSDIEPADTVNVKISYDKGISAEDADHVRIVHFKEDSKTDRVTAEVLKDSKTDITVKKDKLTEAAFEAESFSVYAVVYTVDFDFEVNGQEYAFSLDGGDSTSVKEILTRFEIVEKEEIDAFIENIKDIKTSAPDYMWIKKIDKDTSAKELKAENKLDVEYAANMQKGNIMAMDAHHYAAPDWVLISLQPFTSEETITITMKNGDEFKVAVTDAQSDAIHNEDGTVQTIPNPQGTTFEMFNYFVDESTKTTAGRDQWPGHIHDDNDPYKFNWYNFDGTWADTWNGGWGQTDEWRASHLLGYGNNLGINQGHVFKFTPANAGTVIDGTKGTKSIDGDNGGLNSWTQDADPRQGIVQGTLSNGYPILTNDPNLGTDGSSLAYLFDGTTQNGKESKGNGNHLLYIDPDGYYTYDSRDFKAYLGNDGNFTVSDQPDTDDTELKGFWPYGDEVFWSGMHMNTQFSMPENGQVLNPREEYKDMQFEFSGDDDTWLYIDGVLVGDGGGIHNRTEIDINFATGKAIVTGLNDNVHKGTFYEEKWLDDIFKAAGKYKDSEWEEIPGTNHKRFKAGTYHTFDMFYLERGGGESNLYIHYNLVSTDDFTGHKSYEGFAEDERMHRDQFHFEMIGLDGQYQSVWNPQTQTADVTLVDANGRAIMPTQGRESGAGTFEDPKKVYSESAWKDEEGHTIGGTVFTTGVTENGDVRFGTAEINQDEMSRCDDGRPSLYRYIIREIVPDDAKNAAGITWADATEEQKAAGGFVKDQVKYDGRIYYMTARVTSWDQVGSDGTTYKQYGLSKTYYTDNTFSVVDNDTKFISFLNRYAPDKGEVEFTKTDGANHPLAGAQFTLYTDKACTKIAKDLGDPETVEAGTDQVKTSGTNGKIKFENMAAPRTYYMKETGVPAGYEPNDTLYKVIIEDSKDLTKYSRIIVDGDEDQTPVTKIVNVKSGELSVVKEWQNLDGKPVSGGSYTARVKLQRKHYDERTVWHQVVFTIKIQNRDDLVYTYTAEHISGDVSVDWWDTNQDIAGFEVKDGSGNNLEYTRSNYWDDTNHKNRKVVVSTVAPVINITVEYPAGVSWLFNSEHTPWMKDVSVAGSGADYEPIEDETFNASTDEFHFATLSSSNDWSKIWTLGAGKDFPASDGTNPYLYYVVEVDEQGNPLTPQVMTEDGYQLAGYSSNNTDGVANQGSITVYNQVNDTGVELPYTGGPGMRIIYVFGAMLLCLSAVLMFLRRRRARLQ